MFQLSYTKQFYEEFLLTFIPFQKKLSIQSFTFNTKQKLEEDKISYKMLILNFWLVAFVCFYHWKRHLSFQFVCIPSSVVITDKLAVLILRQTTAKLSKWPHLRDRYSFFEKICSRWAPRQKLNLKWWIYI